MGWESLRRALDSSTNAVLDNDSDEEETENISGSRKRKIEESDEDLSSE